MTLRKSILLLIALTTIAALAGCSSSSTQPLTLTLNTVPTSLQVNSQTALVASVDNDKANGGVVWSCTTTPAGSPCGTFNPATTASGASTTYTAPNFILPSGTTITITATSATNSAISQSSQPISISAANLADGNYVFSVTGYDFSDQSNYTVSGVITVAGGLITGGEQDFVDDEFTAQDDIIAQPANACTVAKIVATCITTAPNGTAGDGNLYIYLATSDGDIGVNGLETFSASVLPLAEGANAGKAALAEFDASATGSGWVERQSSALSLTATPGAGSWAFVLGHADYALAIGGIINIDDLPGTSGGPPTVGTISGAGSIFDADGAGNVIQGGTFTASSVSAGDAFGRVTFTVNSDDFSKLILDGYQISSSKIVLVETGDSFQGALAGIAYAQSVPTHSGVKGFVAADAQNTYVIGMQGADEGSFVLQSAEQLSIAADGSVTGFLDYADFSGVFEPASPDPVSAPAETVVVDPTGRVSIPGITDGADTPLTYNIQLYLDGNGHALALTLDPTDVQDGVGFQQSGASSIATSSFAGPYGMGITGWDADIDGEFDSVGPVVADGSSSFAGFGDVNWLDNFDPGPLLVWNNPVSGAFGTSTASGIFTGTITGIDILNCPVFSGGEGCTPDVFNFYLIDQYGDNIAIETDGMQLSFGYFAQQ
ncbi:MAG: hypothetical protein ABSF93_09845 [Candidatus Sulfotelmatobacter sp.]|jgi:hypothetical protein